MSQTNNEWVEHTPHTRNRIITKQGYVLVWCPEHPNANKGQIGKKGYIFEHRLVMSNHLKRQLLRSESVHHVNGNKADNRIENLILLTNAEHKALHNSQLNENEKQGLANGLVKYNKTRKIERRTIDCSCGCGQTLETPDKKGRTRKYIHGHNQRGANWKWGVRNG